MPKFGKYFICFRDSHLGKGSYCLEIPSLADKREGNATVSVTVDARNTDDVDINMPNETLTYTWDINTSSVSDQTTTNDNDAVFGKNC